MMKVNKRKWWKWQKQNDEKGIKQNDEKRIK